MSYYVSALAGDTILETNVACYSCNPKSHNSSTNYYSSMTVNGSGDIEYGTGQTGTWQYWYWKFNSIVGQEKNLTENNIDFQVSGTLPTGSVGFMYICGQGGLGGQGTENEYGYKVCGGGAGGGEIYIDTLSTLDYVISATLYDTSKTNNSYYTYDGNTINVGNGTNGSSGTTGSSGTSENGGDGGNGGKGGSGGLSAKNGYHYYFGGSGGGGGQGSSGGAGGTGNTQGSKDGGFATTSSPGLGYSTAVYFPDGTNVSNLTSSTPSNQSPVGLAGNGGGGPSASGTGGNAAECMFALFTPTS